ncbi:MAG: hypothetical protein OXU20_24790 [Myxococcales bacterium]|nr:hypothetical protein [Myxococcales bacterium]MDD9969893.1 hypothetical protein [Myxococcales bacterium]
MRRLRIWLALVSCCWASTIGAQTPGQQPPPEQAPPGAPSEAAPGTIGPAQEPPAETPTPPPSKAPAHDEDAEAPSDATKAGRQPVDTTNGPASAPSNAPVEPASASRVPPPAARPQGTTDTAGQPVGGAEPGQVEAGQTPPDKALSEGTSADSQGVTQPAPAPPATATEDQEGEASADTEEGGQANTMPGARGPPPRYQIRFPWSQSVTAATFSRGAQQSYDPTYSWAFRPEFRWFFNFPFDFVFVRQPVSVELTDSNTTARPQQVLLGDAQLGGLTLLHSSEIEKGHSLLYLAGGNLSLPTSKASQAATLVTSLSTSGSVVYFGSLMQGLWIQLGPTLNANFHQSKVPVYGQEVRMFCTPLGGPGRNDCDTGTNANTVWALSLDFTAQLGVWQGLWADISARFTTSRRYGFKAVDFDRVASEDPVPIEPTDDHQAAQISLSTGLTYFFANNLGFAGVSFGNRFSQIGPDGMYREPFDLQDLFIDLSLALNFNGRDNKE